MTAFRLALRSLWYYRRSHLGVLLGVLLTSAVLCGALLMGDSVDGSLRRLALLRLGPVHHALVTPNRFLDASLVDALQGELSTPAAPVLQLRGMAIHQAGDRRQVNRIQVLGVDRRFWRFAHLDLELEPQDVVLNGKLAKSLGVKEGDEISLRIGRPGLLPMEAPLTARSDRRTSRGRFTVRRILTDEELGRFSLSAGQVAPYNAFVSLQAPAVRIEEEAGGDDESTPVNMILVGGESTPDELAGALARVWQPEHFGLRLVERQGVLQLETRRVYLDPEESRAALSIPGARGVLTYLVNGLTRGELGTPYSFVTAGPVPPEMQDDEILVHPWLAGELDLEAGDTLELAYTALLPDGQFEERRRPFKVRQVAGAAGLETERILVPSFPGLTDVDRCSDWDLGLPMKEDLLEDKRNEAYWEQYGPTPKALITLAAGQAMWANRFGQLTGVRWSTEAISAAEVRTALKETMDPARAGWVFQPVREQALQAVSEAMDFSQLFLGMSFFLVIAALMLTGLLFVFGIQQRSVEVGTLLALGWRSRQVRRLLLAEGAVIALAGSVCGAWAGMGYTRFLIWGLSRYWQGAVAGAAIRFFADPGTLAAGAGISFLIALAAMALAMRRQAGASTRDLLFDDVSSKNADGAQRTGHRNVQLGLSLSGVLCAVALVVVAMLKGAESMVMPFFGAGGLLLLSGIGLCALALGRAARNPAGGVPTLARLAWEQAGRRRGRSLAVVSLLACGSFLVFAVSSMQEDLTAHADQSWSGTGGFALYAQSTLPIVLDPHENPPGPTGTRVLPVKVRDGDDASCLNLNHALTPSLLGLPVEPLSKGRAFLAGPESEDVWALLELDLPNGVIPALVGDADTAQWGLKKKTGIEKGDVLTYLDEHGEPFKVKLVGKLPMRLSVFQGTVLISDRTFQQLFPSEEGHRIFLLDPPPGGEDDTVQAWTRAHEREGLDIVPSVERLRVFYGVESTYLAMFLVLGGLGLAVGSLGLGIVVLRNLFERRRDTALLRAVGYPLATVRRLVLLEHGLLVAMGLGCGLVASLVAMQPALTAAQSKLPLSLQAALLAGVACSAALCILLAAFIGLRGDPLQALRAE